MNGVGRSATALKKEEGELCHAVARSSCLRLSTDGQTSHRLPPSGKLPLLFDVVTLTRLSPIPSDAHLSSALPLILSRALLSSVVRMARANITHLAPDILTFQASWTTPSAFIPACKLPGPALLPKLWPPHIYLWVLLLWRFGAAHLKSCFLWIKSLNDLFYSKFMFLVNNVYCYESFRLSL